MAKVVLIDDEVRLLTMLARFLEREGLEVVAATSFAEAEEHLQPGRFEVLVTDIVMPAFDGMQILHEVVNVRQCQEPVILITGDPNLETASQAVRNGAFDYLQKPVFKERFFEVVNRGLRHVKLIRERDQARERELQLLKNLAEIGESASVLSHEIRTPINGLRHALQAVGERLGVEDGVVVGEFIDSLGRIERLLGETLSFARPLIPRLSELSLHDVIDTAVGECRSLDSFANMAVEVSCDRGLRVEADQQHLGEVFVNLLRNAAEACEGVGAVRISAHMTEGSVCIEFVDSGPGVPVRMRDEIFKPFSTSKDYGNGIGLAFSRKVVEAHGGSIELFSGDSGACFRIKLPVNVVIATAESIRV